MKHRPISLLGTAFAAAVLTAAAAAPATAAPAEAAVRSVDGPVVADSYIAVLKPGVDTARASGLTGRHGAALRTTFVTGLRGFSFSGSATAARRIAADPAVAYVQPNAIVSIAATQSPTPSWGLDRIDQRNLPLNNSYTYSNTGSAVHAYIIDTGILFGHSDFGGRASSGRDAVDNDNDATDCNGHGTHVAGTVGGTAYGVAKGVALVGVRVLNCSGSGTTEQVVAGINWVTANAVKPAVANMSLGGGANTAIDDAVRASIASGVTYAIAAGNGLFGLFALDACTQSPARVTQAITVSATNSSDAKPSWANRGTCVDLFAPGISITSAWYTSTTATNTISGTSMATPHVAGAAALYLQNNPGASPATVQSAIIAAATTGVVTSPGSGSPNRLLYTAGF